jgi:membrane-associated phospholipid phosphatase
MTLALPGPVLLPTALRRPVAAAAGVAVVVFAVLTALFAGTSSASRVDRHVETVIDPVGDAHLWFVERAMLLGSPPSVVLIAFVLAAVCLSLARHRLALLAIAGPGVTGIATTTLKPLIGRTIGEGFAFPSGHTGGATSLGLVTALLVISVVRPGRMASLLVLAGIALLAGGGVGFAMVVSDAHYPTDTIGGFCTAVVVVLGGALALDRLGRRRDPHTSG